MRFFMWPCTRAPAAAHQGGHRPPDEEPSSGRLQLHVEAGCGADAESSWEDHSKFPVEKSLHVEEGESAAGSVHGFEVAGSSSEGSVGGSDGDEQERSAAVRRRRGKQNRGGLPVLMAAVGPAAAVMLLALVALVTWKRRQQRRAAAS